MANERAIVAIDFSEVNDVAEFLGWWTRHSELLPLHLRRECAAINSANQDDLFEVVDGKQDGHLQVVEVVLAPRLRALVANLRAQRPPAG